MTGRVVEVGGDIVNHISVSWRTWLVASAAFSDYSTWAGVLHGFPFAERVFW